MTLLDEAIKAQESEKFLEWYKSLSDEDREKFNIELREAVGRITKWFTDLTNYLEDAFPLVFANFAQMLIDFSGQVRRDK